MLSSADLKGFISSFVQSAEKVRAGEGGEDGVGGGGGEDQAGQAEAHLRRADADQEDARTQERE